MADHIRHSAQNDGPVLGTAYARFDPIPEEWEDLIPAYEKWEQEASEGDQFQDSRFTLVCQVAATLATDLGKETGSEADYKVRVRDGSLIVEIFILLPLVDLIRDDTLNLLKMASEDDKLNAWDASVTIGKLIAEIIALDKQIRRIATSLNTLITAIVGRANVIRPEARVGVIGNLITLNSKLDVAKTKSASIKQRANAMKEVYKQLRKIKSVLRKDNERKLVYYYLHIRTRDFESLSSSDPDEQSDIASYNSSIDKILSIKEEFEAPLSF